VLIARAVFLIKRGHTDRQTDKATDAIIQHASVNKWHWQQLLAFADLFSINHETHNEAALWLLYCLCEPRIITMFYHRTIQKPHSICLIEIRLSLTYYRGFAYIATIGSWFGNWVWPGFYSQSPKSFQNVLAPHFGEPRVSEKKALTGNIFGVICSNIQFLT